MIPLNFNGTKVNTISIGSLCSQGTRSYQDDSFGFSSIKSSDVKKHGFTAVVADGMGGLSNGDMISRYVVSSLIDMDRKYDPSVPVYICLSSAMRQINQSVATSGMKGGSTAAAVKCCTEGIYWCAVGDSRIYLFRDGFLTMLNEDSDHFNSLLSKVISAEISFSQADSDPERDSLESYIGCRSTIVTDCNKKPLIPQVNDKLLICSDGVYNALSDNEIKAALHYDAVSAADTLKNTVSAKGYVNQDNFTAIILEFQ